MSCLVCRPRPATRRWSAQDPCRPESFSQILQVQRDYLPARGDLQQARPLPIQAKQPVRDVHMLSKLHIVCLIFIVLFYYYLLYCINQGILVEEFWSYLHIHIIKPGL